MFAQLTVDWTYRLPSALSVFAAFFLSYLISTLIIEGKDGCDFWVRWCLDFSKSINPACSFLKRGQKRSKRQSSEFLLSRGLQCSLSIPWSEDQISWPHLHSCKWIQPKSNEWFHLWQLHPLLQEKHSLAESFLFRASKLFAKS